MIGFILFGSCHDQDRGTASLVRLAGRGGGAPAHLLGFGIAQLVSTAAWAIVCPALADTDRGDRNRTSGRHGVAVGCLRRHGDPLPMMSLFDKQIQLRMGQANVKRWIPDIMPSPDRRGPARRGRTRHSSAAARRGCCGVRNVPAQGRRRGQDHAQAVGHDPAVIIQ
jgi:hypothetical protein